MTAVALPPDEIEAQKRVGRLTMTPAAAAHIAVLIVLLLALTQPWEVLGGGINSAADTAQSSALYRLDPPVEIENPLLTDTTNVTSPWFEESRRELLHLRMPVWNVSEGNGSPHFANPQTAVLSPFSVPIYAFGFQFGYLIANILKIIVAYLGMVQLVRKLGVGLLGQVVAGAAFTLSGYFVVWFYWPLANAMALLPVVVLAFLASYRNPRRRLVAQAAAIVALAVVGHPETAAFSALFVIAAVACYSKAPRREVLIAVRNIAIGLACAAVQIVPFLVYLRQSAVYAGPETNRSFVSSTDFLLSSFAPNGLGRPTGVLAQAISFYPNFNELLGSYLSPVALILAVIGLCGTPRVRKFDRSEFRFRMMVAAVMVGWPIIWFNSFGLGDLVIEHVPAGIALNRAHPVFLLCACLLVAFGARDALVLARSAPSWSKAALAVGVSIVLVLAAVSYPSYVLRHNADAWLPGATTAIAVPTLCCLLGAWAIGALASGFGLPTVSLARLAQATGVVIVLCVLIPPIYGFWRVNPVIDRELFFPDTRTLAAVKDVAGPEGIVLPTGAAATPPNVLSFDKVATPFLYDAINLHGHYELVAALGGGGEEFFGLFDVTDIAALHVLGVSEVVRGRQDPWAPAVDATAEVTVVRPGVACAGEPSCSPAVDGTSSAVLTSAPPQPGEAVIRVPAGLELAAFDETLVYFRVDRAVAAVQSTACVAETDVDDAVAYVAASPARAMARPAVSAGCSVGDGSAPPVLLERRSSENRYGGKNYSVAADRGDAGIVWIPESYYPSWRATVDGRSADVVRVNGAFVGVAVKQGWRAVRFEFVPRDVQLGFGISLVAVLGIAWFWWFDARRDRIRRVAGSDLR